MKHKLKIDENNHPVECPNPELCDTEMDDPISISSDDEGNVLWAYDEVPNSL